jgi:hypothetical protein
MKQENQVNLFDELNVEESWKEHWKDMPEFQNHDVSPFQSIIVHFKSEEDRKLFATLIEQNLTYKTKAIWFPKKNDLPPKNFVYSTTKEENES